MPAYLKRKDDFSTYKAVDVTAHELFLDTTDDTQSTAVLVGEHDIQLGDYFIVDDWVGVLKDSEPNTGFTEVRISPLLTLFDRDLLYVEGTQTSIENFIKTQIETNFINQTDPDYKIPYLSVTANTNTAFIAPETDDDGLYTLFDYINYVRSVKGVYVSASFDNDGIALTVEKIEPDSHNVVFGAMGYELISENYSNKVTAKVTAIANGVATDYYLMEDGTTTTDPTAGTRVKGEWQTFVINQSESEKEKPDAAEKLAEKVADKVASIFAKNSFSHSIEFHGTKKLRFGDTVVFNMRGTLYSSAISQISRSSMDNRYYYKSGEMKVTLTEKLTEVLK